MMSTSTAGTTIQAHQLTKRYGPVLAVDGLSFEVQPGRVTGFLGPNGAGKSTTLRLILGLDAPTAGMVTVGGVAYRRLRRPLFEVGATLESAAVHPGRSAYAHLLALAQANAIPRRRVGEVLGLVGLEAVAGRPARTFSLGMTQRLGVAAALLGDPGVLLLDEPVNGLDPEGVVWIRTLLRALAGEGRTVFVSSHLMSEMALTADQVIVIGRGRLIADTSVAELVRRGSGGHVRVRSPSGERLAELLRDEGATVQAGGDEALLVRGTDPAAVGELAARHGIALHELAVQQISLEEAFMDLTRDAVDYQHTSPTGTAR
jgi:ABC-2 type transport system ATP-binding protein